jgi:hypothetical protein
MGARYLDEALLAGVIQVAPTLHTAGPLASPKVLKALARHLCEQPVHHSVETGAGVTTLLFSHLSEDHVVFAVDGGSGSSQNVKTSPLFNAATTSFVEGPTQKTLPLYRPEHRLQAALLDGPHAFPFPLLEYYYIYPQLQEKALLILADIHIRSVHDLYNFLRADEMFELVEVLERTAFFRRTTAPVFDPLGDGWWLQGYNRTLLLRFTWYEKVRDSIPASARAAARSVRRWMLARQGAFRPADRGPGGGRRTP